MVGDKEADEGQVGGDGGHVARRINILDPVGV